MGRMDLYIDTLIFFYSRFVMPKFVEHKIYTNLPLQEGQEAFEGWKNPPVTPQSNIYVFNLTNEKAFLNGKKNFQLNIYKLKID